MGAVTVDVTYTGGERQRTASVKTDGGLRHLAPRHLRRHPLRPRPPPPPRANAWTTSASRLRSSARSSSITRPRQRAAARGFRRRPRTRPPGELHGPLSILLERASNSRTRRTRASTFGFAISSESPAAPVRKLGGFRAARRSRRSPRGGPPEINNSIKMEVGIEDCLHIEFEYAKAKYHLRDVVVGKIFFLLVRIKIKHMEVEIVAGASPPGDARPFPTRTTRARPSPSTR